MTGLAARLKESTTQAHKNAERAPFFRAFFKGEVPRSVYVQKLQRLYPVYEALEGAMRNSEHPAIAALLMPEVWRCDALREDLVFFDAAQDTEPTAAVERYVARIGEVAKTQPPLLAAHAYTRYLGDVSGGQILAKRARQVLDLQGDEGLSFYRFPLIEDIPAFKDRFRPTLDELPLESPEQTSVVEEASRVFALNRALLDELWS